MKLLTLSILTLMIMTQVLAIRRPKPLRAMLYCYLPAVDTSNPLPEYQNLARIINAKLVKARINVRVEVCDPKGNGGLLYDENAIDSLFDDFDILEVDVSYLWAISTDLLTFKKSEIDYYDKVFPFEWDPLRIPVEGDEDQLKGSPGLLCSTFIETREDDYYENRLYGKFNANSAYGLVDLYLNIYINNDPERTLDDVDYSSVEQSSIEQVAAFLKDCQEDNSVFNYSANWCLKPLASNFFSTNYSKTSGYSENLFNFQNAGIETGYINIDHITQGEKKVFYVDSFVAKDGIDRDTVLAFYKFMLSDEVLDVYVKGLYTNEPKTTYLIPPTTKYLKQISRVDDTYLAISQTAFTGQRQFPIYQTGYAKNVYSLAGLIDEALQNYTA